MPAAAHHNWSAGYFTTDPEIEVEGVITSLTWTNPHVRIGLTVDQGLETEQEWLLESSSVAMLTRMNVTQDTVGVGEKVRVAGWQARKNEFGLYMNHLLLDTGVELIFKRDAEARWPGSAVGDTDALSGRVVEEDINKRPESIFAVWNTIYGDPLSHAGSRPKPAPPGAGGGKPPGGGDQPPPPPRPAEAEYSIDVYDCTPKVMPSAMANPYPVEFVKESDDVIIMNLEEYDIVRTFNMTDTHDDSAAEASLMGYSTGVWEGDKLVVTTTKVTDMPTARFTETFQMREDREYVDYTRTAEGGGGRDAEDTKYWRYVPGTKIEPYACTAEIEG